MLNVVFLMQKGSRWQEDSVQPDRIASKSHSCVHKLKPQMSRFLSDDLSVNTSVADPRSGEERERKPLGCSHPEFDKRGLKLESDINKGFSAAACICHRLASFTLSGRFFPASSTEIVGEAVHYRIIIIVALHVPHAVSCCSPSRESLVYRPILGFMVLPSLF